MRLLFLTALAALTLAGCTVPEEPVDPLFGTCPQWLPLHDPVTASAHVDGALDLHLVPEAREDAQGHPVDRYMVRVHDVNVTGTVEVRAYAHEADRRLAFTDYRGSAPRSLLFLTLEEGMDVELDVYLTAVTHGTAPAPDDLRLEFRGGNATADLLVTMTPMVRVCGVPATA